MGKEITTKYKIGDLVYLATAEDVDRDVIKAIKIVGLKHKISYGIKEAEKGYGLFSFYWGSGDGYNWYSASDIFATQEDAEKRQADLKAKQEAKAELKKLQEIEEEEKELERRRENLKRKKKGLPPLEDDDDWED